MLQQIGCRPGVAQHEISCQLPGGLGPVGDVSAHTHTHTDTRHSSSMHSNV